MSHALCARIVCECSVPCPLTASVCLRPNPFHHHVHFLPSFHSPMTCPACHSKRHVSEIHHFPKSYHPWPRVSFHQCIHAIRSLNANAVHHSLKSAAFCICPFHNLSGNFLFTPTPIQFNPSQHSQSQSQQQNSTTTMRMHLHINYSIHIIAFIDSFDNIVGSIICLLV
jgi:hypothetical protein